MSGFETRALKAGAAARPAAPKRHLYVTAWTARALSADAGPEAAAASSLVLSGAVSSVASGAGATRATAAAAGGPRSVAFAAGVGGARAERDSLAVMAAAFDIVRAHTAKVALPVWLLTSRAFGARPSGGSGASAHAGMMGLARQVRSEAPTCRLPVIDLDAAAAVAGSAAAAAMLGLGYSGLPEPEVAFDAGRPRVPRLAEAPGSISGPVRMHFDARGAVSNLRIVPQAEESSPPADGEVELRVRAVGLNFRDVLNVLGVYPGDPGPPGSDCAADVARCGGGAPHLRVGDAVLGHGLAALASFARSDSRLMAAIDDSLTVEQACTLPTTWCTVHMSLLASRPRAGHHALLQAGAGGVGLAAGEYTHWVGTRASVTVGRPYKHWYLHGMGLRGETLSSRDGGAFLAGAAALVRASRLRFVLNSLSADFIAGSFALLGEGGCLCEIGKRAVWSAERLRSASLARYVAIALDSTIEQTPVWMRGTLQRLSARAAARVLHGLPLQSFGLERGLLSAFRSLQAGTNTGKVVILIPATATAPPRDTHLLSGGTGGLGLLTGRWLAAGGASTVVLAARGGAVSEADGARLRKARPQCSVCVARADAAELADIRRLVSGARCGEAGRLAGLWHAAGVLSDGLLRAQTASTLRRVYAPKVHGAWGLQLACAAAPLDACVLFSSIASLIGGGGQSNYGAANGCLDSLGVCRRQRGQAASSVQWGPWADVGMAASSSVNARIQASGMGLIGLEQGATAFRAALLPGVPAVMSLVVLSWGKFLGLMPTVPPLLEGYASRKAAPAATGGASESRVVTLEMIMESLESTIGTGVDADAPLMEAGLDSLGAVELGNQLQQASGQTLPSTLIFDYPTARQLAAYFESSSKSAGGSDEAAGAATSAATARAAATPFSAGSSSTSGVVRVCGLSAMMPGRVGLVSGLAQMASCGSDLISEVPLGRWRVGGPGFPDGVIGQRARYGGFLSDAELFDNAFFSVSPSEAGAMDPQQRLLLERSFEALHGASFQRTSLMDLVAGVFLGVAANDFAEVVRTTPSLARSVYAATGSSHSVASGRISFVLGMQGPCVSYDTACSAALAANHAALRALQHRECVAALSVGVSMMLLPGVGITFATAGMLSAGGHCHTFDSRADGYVRGEACCAATLRVSSFATHDTLRLVGCCVRQDGKRASLTALNGQAQRALLWAAPTPRC